MNIMHQSNQVLNESTSSVLNQNQALCSDPIIQIEEQPPMSVQQETSPIISYKTASKKWIDHNTVNLIMTAHENCNWYCFIADANTPISTIQNMCVPQKAINKSSQNTDFIVAANNITERDSWLIIYAESNSQSQILIIKLETDAFKKLRPDKPSIATLREPYTYDVSESVVTGLEKPLKFYPGKFYEFSVTGAGQNDQAPYIIGDERWIPLYWSTTSDPDSSSKNSAWKIGSSKGITNSQTYTMYIFFKKEIFDGVIWSSTDTIAYKPITFVSATINTNDLNTYLYGSSLPKPQANISSLILSKGQSTQTVKIKNLTNDIKILAWFSDDTDIAAVTQSGKITGKKVGHTIITVVLSSGDSIKIKVTVQKSKVRTKSITGIKKKATINKGKTLKLKPIISPATSQEKITYSSSNSKILSVSSKGIVKAKKRGTAKITVKSGSKKTTITITVPKTYTKKISGIKSNISIRKGKKIQIKAKTIPANSDEKISYSSSNKKVATISSKGTITGKKKGSTVITIKSGKIKTKCKVTVK